MLSIHERKGRDEMFPPILQAKVFGWCQRGVGASESRGTSVDVVFSDFTVCLRTVDFWAVGVHYITYIVHCKLFNVQCI